MKRALQYAGLSALGIGGKLIKNKSLNQAINRSFARKMSSMKGVPVKISQIMGMSDKDSSELHRQALETIDPMPLKEVEVILLNEVPSLLENAQIDEHFHCASLGQVCKLTKDTQDYAVKIQYPDSAENMTLDNKAMGLVTKSFQNFSKGFDMSEYTQVLKEELNLELDYLREVDMQHEFYRIFSDNHDIVIPLSMKKYSSATCLVMSWEPSISLEEFTKVASEKQLKEASRLVTEFYLTSILKNGLMHSDPNPGNFGFRLLGDKVQLVVYDFGSVVKLSHEQHMQLLSLFKLCREQKSPLAALVELKFNKDLLLPIADKIPVFLSVLLEPFLSDGIFEYKNWRRKEKVKDILGEDRWNFMAAAPAELFLLMRSISGLFFYTERLSGSIYCLPRMKEYLQKFAGELLKVENAYSPDLLVKTLQSSNHLIISVRESGMQKVKLTLPVKAIENLKNFIPEDVASKLKGKNIIIETLVSEVRKNAYTPQDVFSLVDGEKEVLVYLE